MAKTIEPEAFNRAVAQAITAAEEEFLEALAHGYELALQTAGRRIARALHMKATPITAAGEDLPPFIPPDEDEVMDAEALERTLAKRAGETREKIAGALAAELEASGISFDVGGVFSDELMEAVGKRAVFATDKELRETFRTVIAEAMEEGWGVPETARAISERVTQLAPARATALARTDLIGLANAGSQQAAQQTFAEREDVWKTWVATMDPLTRPEHLFAHDQSVPLNETYTVGGEPLRFPGDPLGSDEMVINCRCTQIYGDAPGEKAVRASGGFGAPSEIVRSVGIQESQESQVFQEAGPDTSELAMVAVYPQPEEAEALAVEGGTPAEELHVTLVFLGEAGELDELNASAALATAALVNEPLEGSVGGRGAFSATADGVPVILLPDVQGLTRLREDAVSELAVQGIESPSDHGFLPHMTLRYAETAELADEEALGQTLTFDSISLVVGGRRTDYPLGGQMSNRATRDSNQATRERARTAAVTITVGEDEAPATAAATRWRSEVAFENWATEDGRFILPDALSWREPPLSLMAMVENQGGGHLGSQVAGKMETFAKQPATAEELAAANAIEVVSEGAFSQEEYGAMVARMVENEELTGISVDLAIQDWLFRDPDTGELLEPDEMTEDDWERAWFDELQFAVREATILAATVCPTPAFAEAKIAVIASAFGLTPLRHGQIEGLPGRRGFYRDAEGQLHMILTASLGIAPLTAAAVAAIPAAPPRSVFDTTEFPGPTPLTATDVDAETGWRRVFGHLADWETCHVGISGVCTKAPPSPSGYAYYHVGEVETAEGEVVSVGKLMIGTKHASLQSSRGEATQHYDDHGQVAAYVVARDGEHGIWLSGIVRHDLTEGQLREFRANPPSGDWRGVGGKLELIAACCVPVPGFPIPRAQAAITAAADELTISALIAHAGEILPSDEVIAALVAAGCTSYADELPVESEEGIEAIAELVA